MDRTLEQVKIIFPKQLCLGFSQEDQEKARSLETNYETNGERYRAFLNGLCLEIVAPVLQDIFDQTSDCQAQDNYSLSTQQIKDQHLSIWKSMNGVAIALPQGRLILIPSEDEDTEELRVEKAWVDSPDFAGDFYLAIQVDMENSWLRVWGITTHKELKEQGCCDAIDNSYAIEYSAVSDQRITLETIPAIWNQKIVVRAEVTPVTPEVLLEQSPVVTRSSLELLNNFSQKVCEAVWQPWDELVGSLKLNLAIVRSHRFTNYWVRQIDKTLKMGDRSLAVVVGFQEEGDRKYLIQVGIYPTDGEIYLPPDLELIILESSGKPFEESKSKDIDSWIQVEFRGKFEEEFQIKIQLGEVSITESITISSFTTNSNCIKIPVFPEPWILGSKDIRKLLGADLCVAKSGLINGEEITWGRSIEILSHTLALVLSSSSTEYDRNNIMLRLYPTNNQRYLPEGVNLICRDSNGTEYIKKAATEDRNFIEISFRCPIGKGFITEVQLLEYSFRERFVVGKLAI